MLVLRLRGKIEGALVHSTGYLSVRETKIAHTHFACPCSRKAPCTCAVLYLPSGLFLGMKEYLRPVGKPAPPAEDSISGQLWSGSIDANV
jgi:hypothetical protein